MTTTLTLFLLVIAAICDAMMDHIEFRLPIQRDHPLRINSWWNPIFSQWNKYKNTEPEDGPAFPGSTTIFVWVTDAWHFFKTGKWTALELALALGIYPYILLYLPAITPAWLDVLLLTGALKVARASTFHTFFHYVFSPQFFSIMKQFKAKAQEAWHNAKLVFLAAYQARPLLTQMISTLVVFGIALGAGMLHPGLAVAVLLLFIVAGLVSMFR